MFMTMMRLQIAHFSKRTGLTWAYVFEEEKRESRTIIANYHQNCGTYTEHASSHTNTHDGGLYKHAHRRWPLNAKLSTQLSEIATEA